MILDLEDVGADQKRITEKSMVMKMKVQTNQEEVNDLLLQMPEELWSPSFIRYWEN